MVQVNLDKFHGGKHCFLNGTTHLIHLGRDRFHHLPYLFSLHNKLGVFPKSPKQTNQSNPNIYLPLPHFMSQTIQIKPNQKTKQIKTKYKPATEPNLNQAGVT
jgi:hypothetical protein